MASEEARLVEIVRRSPLLAPLIQRWPEIALRDGWIAAGALAQTVWNEAFRLPPRHGVSDIDLVYFDDVDLSAEAEAAHAVRVHSLFAELDVWLDVKNEARVHLWYTERFGRPIAPYRSTRDAITTFPTTATAIGLRPQGRRLEVFAPYGLSDLLNGIVRPNKAQITQAVYEAKVTKWRSLWPGLRVIPWDVPS